ncbi:MAG: prepilin-type N-terminal cleavage/methylation domain-containing protein [Gemmatimonadales bacterium]
MHRVTTRWAGTRRGFTLMELLLVVVVIGILLAMTAPSISAALARRNVRGATAGFESFFRRARATAVGSRLPATITFASGVASVSIVRNGSSVAVGQNLDFAAQYNVSVSTTAVTLQIEPTGLVLSGTPFLVIATKGDAADTARITGYGRVE